MAMSRKNYEAIARILADNVSDFCNNTNTVASVACDLADYFKEDNPNFRYDHFFKACGLDEWGNPKQ